jgi:hypothetical protein
VELLVVPHPLVELADQVVAVMEELDLLQVLQELLIPVAEVEVK